MTHLIPTEDELRAMRLPDLQALFAQTTGQPSRSPNKTYLARRIRATLQELVDASSTPPDEPPPADIRQESTPPEEEIDDVTVDKNPETYSEDPGAPSEDAEQHPLEVPLTSSPITDREEKPAVETQRKGADVAPLKDPFPEALPSEHPPPTPDTTPGPALRTLSITQLRERYREVVGRDTSSVNRAYLMWKIRQAQLGKVPVGPRRATRTRSSAEHKVLPVRMSVDVVEKLDDARERLGLPNRMELFRRALHTYFTCQDENEVAALFDPDQ